MVDEKAPVRERRERREREKREREREERASEREREKEMEREREGRRTHGGSKLLCYAARIAHSGKDKIVSKFSATTASGWRGVRG